MGVRKSQDGRNQSARIVNIINNKHKKINHPILENIPANLIHLRLFSDNIRYKECIRIWLITKIIEKKWIFCRMIWVLIGWREIKKSPKRVKIIYFRRDGSIMKRKTINLIKIIEYRDILKNTIRSTKQKITKTI